MSVKRVPAPSFHAMKQKHLVLTVGSTRLHQHTAHPRSSDHHRAAWLPLDPSAPTLQLARVLDHAQPDALIYDAALPPPKDLQLPCPAYDLQTLCNSLALAGLHAERISPADHIKTSGSQAGAHTSAYLTDPPFCYVLYTSGSTGYPLGVCGTPRGLLNRLLWMQGIYPLLPNHAVAFGTSTAFVDHIWEVFAPLMFGADMVVLPDGWALRPGDAVQLLVGHKISHLVRQLRVQGLRLKFWGWVRA